ncbi:hypothetical protein [Mycobacterium noviomagense]|uniref:Uncharacterized protein n=1 Tax=Mycobacterium noviomagense TaxID=459858 RepID=A0A7I7PK45_9MYCO|nr:hypothetical protein [Mycobacterium noviomagense]ORB16271.1 hypothetical protein BST37_06855 [Mycobacterium noviomagense]BBY08936.1 hypothetical protein MNVI_42540 [Mycobacterium noviomagense]
MKLKPLPIRTKIYAGETVDSFAHRASVQNHTTVKAVETALVDSGDLKSRARSAHGRPEAWRQLGLLRADAFCAPTTLEDNVIHERNLCLHCTRGEVAVGRIPGTGMVCLRHRRWVGQPQLDIRDYRPALSAERRFRALFRSRGLVFDCTAMMIGLETAVVALGGDELERRRTTTGIPAIEALAYREQVAIAQMLTSTQFLDTACNPSLATPVRYAHVTAQFAAALRVDDRSDLWRGVERIWAVVRTLTNELRRAASHDRIPDDTQFKLLRYSSLPARYRSAGESVLPRRAKSWNGGLA